MKYLDDHYSGEILNILFVSFFYFSWAGFLCFHGPSFRFLPFLLQDNKTNLYQLLTTPIKTRYISQDTVH